MKNTSNISAIACYIMPQVRNGRCRPRDWNNSVQTWQFAFNEKYSWFSPRAFFKGGLCHGRKRSVMLTLESLLRCFLIREPPSLPLTHLPSRAATPFSLSQRTPPGLASLCCNKYMFPSFYCEIFGWRKVILVIVQIFEDRIFFLSSPN